MQDDNSKQLLSDQIERRAHTTIIAMLTLKNSEVINANCTPWIDEDESKQYDFDEAHTLYCEYILAYNTVDAPKKLELHIILQMLNKELELLDEDDEMTMIKTGEIPNHFYCP